ncbi:MAG: GNAT family N-acetyltransferase, partial [Gemmatimonadota bacterium]
MIVVAAAPVPSPDGWFVVWTESRAEKAAFMTSDMTGFFRRVIGALSREDLVELIFLTLDRVRVAAVVCFRTEGELLLYNSG